MDLGFKPAGVCLFALLLATAHHAEDWSRFRGPNGSGISKDTGFPTEFGPTKNVVWKSSVRQGKSSPVLTEKQLFLTAYADEKLYTQCFDRQTGKLVWEKFIDRPRKVLIHKLNEPAAITPVTDGANVYVFFPDFGLLSYDVSGKLRWQTPLGPFTNAIGLSSSPILADGRLILQVDQYIDSYIAAFDPVNGKTLWKTSRSETKGWSTPIIYRPGGKGGAQILTVADRLFGAYQLKTGKRTFTADTLAGAIVASPVVAGDMFYALGYNNEGPPRPFEEQLGKFDNDGDGRVTALETNDDAWMNGLTRFAGNRDGVLTREEWDVAMKERSGPSSLVAFRLEPDTGSETVRATELWRDEKSFMGVVPSPLVYQNVLYYVKNGGILAALDANAGKMLKQDRVKGALDPFSSSPVAGEGKIYLASESGKIAVIKPGSDWEVITVNDLKEDAFATPALSKGQIFLRTRESLYCFGTVAVRTTSSRIATGLGSRADFHRGEVLSRE
jgi:outer membrane protein assembly factor BamB